MIYAICNPNVMSKVETGALEELERLVKDGVKADELEKARSGYLQQLKVMRSNDSTLANLLANRLFADRTMKYDAELETRLKALTPESVPPP